MSDDVSTYFDQRAEAFDSIYLGESRSARAVNRLVRRAVYERFRLALVHSGDLQGKTVLDVGCGPGRYVVEYARRGASKVVGVDFAARMLALGRDLATAHGVADVCTFVEGDFMELELGEPFDVVLAMGVFDYISDPEAFLGRLAQVSRGVVIASFPGTSRVRMRLRAAKYKRRGCPLFFFTRDQVEELASNAGFTDYELIYLPHSGTGWVLVGHAAPSELAGG